MEFNKDKIANILAEIAVHRNSLATVIPADKARPGMEIFRRQATDAIDALQQQYLQELRKGVLLVFLVGDRDKVAQFSSVILEDRDMLLNVEEMFMRLAVPAERTIGARREFTTHQFSFINQEVYELAKELGVWEYPKLVVDPIIWNTTVPTPEDTLNHVRKIVSDTFGVDLTKIYVEQNIYKMAVEAEYDQPVLPVFVSGVAKSDVDPLAKACFGGRAMMIDFDDEKNAPTPELLHKTFRAVKKYFVEAAK